MLGTAVRRLDPSARTLVLEDGSTLAAAEIVVTTGGRPRAFGCVPDRAFTLRGRDDARMIREAMAPGRHMVVIGGGFIGAEVTATARREGLEVTLVEVQPTPFAALLGSEVGGALARAHRRRGVQLECGLPVNGLEPGAHGPTVILADGRRLSADLAVVGLGLVPNVEWLQGSGLSLADGVVCDDRGRTSAPGVHAAGDVAAWLDVDTGIHRRGQHWTGAREQGLVVAHDIVGAELPAGAVDIPYFWSDQFDLRLQCFGEPVGIGEWCVTWGSIAEESFVSTCRHLGRLTAVVGVNAARQVRQQVATLRSERAPTMGAVPSVASRSSSPVSPRASL